MKYFFSVLACIGVVCVCSVCFSSPFLVCDQQTGVQTYVITGPSWVPTTPISAQVDGSLKFDVAGAGSVVGTNSLTIKACKSDAVWGQVCSTAAPFSFTRPSSTLLAPSSIRLVP